MSAIDELTRAYRSLSAPTFPQVSMPRGRTLRICRGLYWRNGQFYVKHNNWPISGEEVLRRYDESALEAGIRQAIEWCHKMRSWREKRAQRAALRDQATPEVLREMEARNATSFLAVVEELLGNLYESIP